MLMNLDLVVLIKGQMEDDDIGPYTDSKEMKSWGQIQRAFKPRDQMQKIYQNFTQQNPKYPY